MSIKQVVLYANRNVGVVAMLYLLSRGFKVRLITESNMVRGLANSLGVEAVSLETMGKFDIFICCHGRKIIPRKHLVGGRFINIHPCLYLYKGHNPVKRYIENKNTTGSVESQYMEEEVDSGQVINQQFFETGVVKTYAEFYNIALPHYVKCINETINEVGGS